MRHVNFVTTVLNCMRPLLPHSAGFASVFMLIGVILRSTVYAASVLTTLGYAAPSLVVPQYSPQDTLLFNVDGKKIGTIAGASGSAVTDAMGILYLSSYRSNFVKVFGPPYNALQRELRFPHMRVERVAVDARTGLFAVLQDSMNANGVGPGKISFFRRGADAPCDVVPRPNGILAFDGGAAFDRSGKLFYLGDDSNAYVQVEAVQGGCKAAASTLLTNMSGVTPAWLAFNTNDDIVIQDYFRGRNIYTFQHPDNGQLGQPISQTVLNEKVNGLVPVMLVMSSDGASLWAGSSATTIDRYAYPGGGNPLGPTLNVRNGGIMAVIPEESP